MGLETELSEGLVKEGVESSERDMILAIFISGFVKPSRVESGPQPCRFMLVNDVSDVTFSHDCSIVRDCLLGFASFLSHLF